MNSWRLMPIEAHKVPTTFLVRSATSLPSSPKSHLDYLNILRIMNVCPSISFCLIDR